MFLAMSQAAAHHQACQELLAKVWLAGGSEMFMVQLSKQGSIHVNMVYIGISTFELTLYLKFFRHNPKFYDCH